MLVSHYFRRCSPMDLLCGGGLWLLCIAATMSINQQRGHSAVAGLVIGALLGPLGILLALLSPKDAATIERRQIETGQSKRCPHCANMIKREARVCQFCHRDLTGAPVSPAPVAQHGGSDQLLRQAINALQQGKPNEARSILVPLVQREPRNVDAWFWLSGTSTTVAERRQYLEYVLSLNPQHTGAQQELGRLKAL